MVYRLLLSVTLAACSLSGQPRSAVTRIDFRNFTFPFPSEESRLSVPGDLSWMNNNASTTVTLVDGRWDSNKRDPSMGPSVTLWQVQYGYLTMSGHLDAVVVLQYHTGGSAQWSYVYACSLARDTPRLLGWLHTGDRGYSGLRELFVSNGEFTLDVFDPAEAQTLCCSGGFIRTTYEWRSGKFVAAEPPKYGRVEEDPKPR